LPPEWIIISAAILVVGGTLFANRTILLRAWEASVSSMSTGTLAVVGGLLYPLANAFRVWRQDGFVGMGQHWRENLKYSCYIAIAWWGLLFSYHLFWTVPKQIYAAAGQTHPPLVSPPFIPSPKISPSPLRTTAKVKIAPAPSGSIQLVRWEPFPTGGSPVGAHVHFLNTWPVEKRISFVQVNRPVLLSDLKEYSTLQKAQDDLWSDVASILKDRPLKLMVIPSNSPVWIQIDLPEPTKQMIATGDYGAAVALIGRDGKGSTVIEACVFLTDKPDVVQLCNGHNRISRDID
jgi:hypothetical protein